MASLYANENSPFQVVQALRDLGHDVLTTFEAGKANQFISDEKVLEFATQNQRVILTIIGRDFIHLNAIKTDLAGIIVCSQDADIGGQAERIHREITSRPSLEGQLVRINRPIQ